MKLQSLFHGLLILSATSALANTTAPPSKDTIINAIEMIENTDESAYQYTVTSTGSTNTIEQHNPKTTPKWTLVKIEGKEPTKKQRKKYQKEKEITLEEQDESTLAEIFQFPTITFNRQEGDNWYYSFKPVLKELNKKSQQAFEGEITYNSQQDMITQFRFYNTDQIKPFISVELSTLQFEFNFQKIGNDILMTDNSNKIIGKAAFVKTFNEDIQQQFSNYQKIN